MKPTTALPLRNSLGNWEETGGSFRSSAGVSPERGSGLVDGRKSVGTEDYIRDLEAAVKEEKVVSFTQKRDFAEQKLKRLKTVQKHRNILS